MAFFIQKDLRKFGYDCATKKTRAYQMAHRG
jgi:hypothetical protein